MTYLFARCTHRATLLIATVAMLSTQTSSAQSETFGESERGAQIAQEWCSECHQMPDGPQPSGDLKGPKFSTISAMPSTTRMSLTVWFRTPHPSMPNLVIEENDANDLIAYILGLKNRP
ncbi:MAG: c-type cytochrome [Hyphomicrobiales bacterium]